MNVTAPLCFPRSSPQVGFHTTPARPAPWYAVYTRARHEKRVAEHLSHRGISHFLPTYRALRTWGHRRAELELPVFPCYLFVQMTAAERLGVVTAPGVVRVVSFGAAAATVPAQQVESLRALVMAGNARPHEYIGPGDRARFVAGPLSGLEGTVIRRRGSSSRVVVSLDFIMRSMAVEVDEQDLVVGATLAQAA